MQENSRLFPWSNRYSGTLVLLALLLSVDLLFILAHMLHVWSPWLGGDHFSIESDDGMAELYQYIQFLWLCGCLALAFLQTRAAAYLAWMTLFGFLLLDDAAQFHERAGTYLALQLDFSPAFGLRAKDYGEIAFAGVIGVVVAVFLVFTFWRGSRQAQHVSADMALLLCALAFFGVVCDALHTIAYFVAPGWRNVLSLLEDGGEMIVVSVLTAYAFDAASNSGKLRISLWQGLQRYATRRSLMVPTAG